MLTIRLTRVGKTKQPEYRLIISEKSKDPWGNALEILGYYNPRTNPRTLKLKTDRIKYWLSQGAQTSPTVHNLLVDEKIIDAPKVKASKNKPKKPALSKVEGPAEEKKEEPKQEKKPEEIKEKEKKPQPPPKADAPLEQEAGPPPAEEEKK